MRAAAPPVVENVRAAQLGADAEGWAMLTKAGMGLRGGKSEILWWVFRNMSVPVSEIDLSTVPDQGAPAFLREVRGTPAARWLFLEKIFPWPSKMAQEHEGGAWDDGRQTIELLDAMDRALGAA